MTHDSTYVAARALQRAGQWDLALRQLPAGDGAAALRAEILTDRHLWRLDPVSEALDAIRDISADLPEVAAYLGAQLEYWRRLLKTGNEPLAGDPVDTFASLVDYPPLRGWAQFWYGITLEALRADIAEAGRCYALAREVAHTRADPLMESYAVRHQAGLALEAGDRETALALARRSLHLRAALGARPHVAAAQALLADTLGDGPEAAELRVMVASTATELGLAWLMPDGTPSN